MEIHRLQLKRRETAIAGHVGDHATGERENQLRTLHENRLFDQFRRNIARFNNARIDQIGQEYRYLIRRRAQGDMQRYFKHLLIQPLGAEIDRDIHGGGFLQRKQAGRCARVLKR